MDSIKSALDHLIFVTPSGTEHPYFGLRSEKMFARVTSSPPLGYDTIVHSGKSSVSFNVLVESDPPKAEQEWEVQLWHNAHDALKWEALPLQATSPRLVITQTEMASKLRRQWFTATLELPPSPLRPASFSLKFRAHHKDTWKWVQTQSGTHDGRLLYHASNMKDHSLEDYIGDLNPELQFTQEHSDTPDTKLWSIQATAKPAHNDESCISEYPFGLPKDFVRWFSLVRLWSPWLAPRQGTEAPLAEKDGVLYSFLREDGLHVVALAVSGIDDVLTTFKAGQDRLVISARNDSEEDGVARVLVAVGKTLDTATGAAVYHARQLISKHHVVSPEMEGIVAQLEKKDDDSKLHVSWVQDWIDGFTYCTWNGLGQNLTEEKISNALASLKKEGINIMNLIIDDNWQDLNNDGKGQMVQGWRRFEANTKGFPEGLKSAITKIRDKHPNIKHIGVWHALLGYWGGIDPNGELAKKFKTIEVPKRSDVAGGKITVIDKPSVSQFYDEFYAFLNSAGIDAVKTDAQFFLDEISSASARRSLTTTYLNVWMTAQLRHFSGRAISCMSQTPTILFHSQLPSHLPALPTRNSDDFFPDIEASHPWHIFCNAHNSLLNKYLNILPDWDMFQTSHSWAGFHAAARAVSGGPIYITDEPGKHDISLIKQFTAVTSRDQTVILRPSVVGRSAQAYVGFEEEKLCNIAAYHGRSGTDGSGSFLGVFNCKDHELAELIPLSDFLGTETGEYVVRSHRVGAVSAVMNRQHTPSSAVIAIEVAGRGWDILTATPVHSAPSPPQDSQTSPQPRMQISNLGLVGKMTGAAAVISTSLRNADPAARRLRVSTTLKALGVLGLWVSCLADLDVEADFMVLLEGKPVPAGRVARSGACECVLEIDVEGAWGEMGLVGGWSNEVDVEVFIGLRKEGGDELSEGGGVGVGVESASRV